MIKQHLKKMLACLLSLSLILPANVVSAEDSNEDPSEIVLSWEWTPGNLSVITSYQNFLDTSGKLPAATSSEIQPPLFDENLIASSSQLQSNSEPQLIEDENQWILMIPGVNEKNLLTKARLKKLLPSKIAAVTKEILLLEEEKEEYFEDLSVADNVLEEENSSDSSEDNVENNDSNDPESSDEDISGTDSNVSKPSEGNDTDDFVSSDGDTAETDGEASGEDVTDGTVNDSDLPDKDPADENGSNDDSAVKDETDKEDSSVSNPPESDTPDKDTDGGLISDDKGNGENGTHEGKTEDGDNMTDTSRDNSSSSEKNGDVSQEKDDSEEEIVVSSFSSAASVSEKYVLAVKNDNSATPSEAEQTDLSGRTRERSIKITWDLSDFPEDGLSSGSYVVAASLPSRYALADDAPELSITVVLSGVQSPDMFLDFAIELESDEIRPSGTVIHLFDYWTGDSEEERFKADNCTYTETVNESGINKDHCLKFGKDMQNENSGSRLSINAWTGNRTVRPEIVQTTLQNGYPILTEGKNFQAKTFNKDKTTEEQPLRYLFDPNVDNPGKKSFSDVGGLLQTDEKGYYYYDSEENYAWFDENSESQNFVLYEKPGVKSSSSSTPNLQGQFFPFNEPGDVFEVSNGELIQKNIKTTDNSMYHYFGVFMSTRFVQKDGGTIYGEEPITYDFSGDDDVWVFIDGVLVADLGGIHDRASLSIDFQTGSITINEDAAGTLKSKFVEAQKEHDAEWAGNTFKDDTYHTLNFYYLERGNTDSNMSLKFNLISIPESEITKVDQEGNPVAGAEFELYPATRSGSPDEYGDYLYEIMRGYEDSPIYSGTTDENGLLRIIDESTNSPLTFKEFYQKSGTEYFILRESEVPPGFRRASDTYLYYVPSTGLTLSGNYWDTGSYAEPKITTTVTTKLYKANPDGTKDEEILDLSDPGIDLTNNPPVVFAVVFKRLDMNRSIYDSSNWAPISGNSQDGWKIWDDTSVDMLERIKQAAEANGDAGQQNLFYLSRGGAFQATIENLPGNVVSYYWYISQQGDDLSKAQYTVNYYYLNSGNEEIVRLYTDDFTREFSTHIIVPDIRNYLVVEKVNEKKEPMNGAEFALYEAQTLLDAEAINADGTVNYTKLGNLPSYDEATTATLSRTEKDKINGDGVIVFPSATMHTEDLGKNDILENGEYYLVEKSSGNSGYTLNAAAVKVVVDDTGVYVDAGKTDDGISTHRAVGSVLKSMLQFAVDDGIDASLQNVKAQLKTAESYSAGAGDSAAWSSWKNDPEPQEEQHLYYNDNRGADDLGMEYSPYQNLITMTSVSETGWNRLEIRQCLEHDTIDEDGKFYTSGKKSERQNIADRDIRNLFSTVMYVTVENRPSDTGNLVVSKTVEGNDQARGQEFTFTVTVKDSTGAPISGEYLYTGGVLDPASGVTAPEPGKLTFDTTGSATINLKHGQTISILYLPGGAQYTISEQKTGDYEISSEGESGTIIDGQSGNAAFTNIYISDNPDPDPDPDNPEDESGGLSVSKIVSGSRGDTGHPFVFTIKLGDTSVQGAYGDMTFADGIATFTLKHGETRTASNLPAGIRYTVTESDNSGYSVTATGNEGIIPEDSIAEAVFNNYRGGNGGGRTPTLPDNPDDSVRTDTITELSAPQTSVTPSVPVDDSPKTGDETNLVFWMTVMGSSAILLFFAVFILKKQAVKRSKSKESINK